MGDCITRASPVIMARFWKYRVRGWFSDQGTFRLPTQV